MFLDYDLPPHLLADRPLDQRGQAKLLLSVAGGISHHQVQDLVNILGPEHVLVYNNTQVIPAYLHGQHQGRQLTINLLKVQPNGSWQALARGLKKIHLQDRIDFGPDFHAMVQDKQDAKLILTFHGLDLAQGLKLYGAMPLPPYILKKRESDAQDFQDYQSIFAQHQGAVAAPTASLHFTSDLWQALHNKGLQSTAVTLHVGGGTFLPIKDGNIDGHVMHEEWAHISAESARCINQWKQEGKKIIALGTTALRCLESFAQDDRSLGYGSKETGIFIKPGYDFKIIDGLMTNFHLPHSTLLVLINALLGPERTEEIYQQAIQQAYRFYSYGDTSLLMRTKDL